MRKGFTVIEFLIIVVVIGILAAIAIPKFSKAGQRARMQREYAAASPDTPSQGEVDNNWHPIRGQQDILPSGTVVTCYKAYYNSSELSCVIDPRQFNTP